MSAQKQDSLEKIEIEVKGCPFCRLANTRKNAVPGEGDPSAKIMFIGEAPGRTEDEKGRPFVGAAGKILDSILEKVGIERSQVFITNVVKCRPPSNREPEEDEVVACRPYLNRQIALINPEVICILGRTAYSSLLGGRSITADRGRILEKSGQKYFLTFHPAAAIYNRKLLFALEKDIKKLAKEVKKRGQKRDEGPTMSCLPGSFYRRPTQIVARDLIGKMLVRTIIMNGKAHKLAGKIVETEAYGYTDDLASHACKGPTDRNRIMFGDVGRAYVYFTYGNHYCLNVSARSTRFKAGAVLLRSIEPSEGIEVMKKLRAVKNVFSLTSGPGKLTEALGITLANNGMDLTIPESELHIDLGSKPARVLATPRVGISRATDKEWRFVDPSSPYLSKRIRTL